MLLALRHPCPDSGALKLPHGLDSAESIVEFRSALGTQLQHGSGDILIDCAGITQIAPPLLGWLISVSIDLAGDSIGRRLVLIAAEAEFRLQLRTLGNANERLVVLPVGRR